MHTNYLLFLRRTLPARPVCHRKITFSRGILSKCKAPGKIALEPPRDLGERDSSHEGAMPLQPGTTPTWTGRGPSIFLRPNRRGLGHKTPDNCQRHGSTSGKVTTLLVNTTLLSPLCGSEAFISVKARKLENTNHLCRIFPFKNVCGTMESRKSSMALPLDVASAADYWMRALASSSGLTSALWLNTDVDLVTATCISFVVLPPGLASCLGNEFSQPTFYQAHHKLSAKETEEGGVLSDTHGQLRHGTWSSCFRLHADLQAHQAQTAKGTEEISEIFD